MLRKVSIVIAISMGLAACETTSQNFPYQPSINSLSQIQEIMKPSGLRVKVGPFIAKEGVNLNPKCRLMGSIDVAPGSTPLEYIKSALQREFFSAGAYDEDSKTVIKGRLDDLEVGSFGRGHWDIALTVSSNYLPEGYQVKTSYLFKTSFTAYGACKNVAKAYPSAVQQLMKNVTSNPSFARLVGAKAAQQQ